MAVEIKELVIKGFINGSKAEKDTEVIALIDEKIKKINFNLSESDRQQIITECMYEFKTYLDHKLNY